MRAHPPAGRLAAGVDDFWAEPLRKLRGRDLTVMGGKAEPATSLQRTTERWAAPAPPRRQFGHVSPFLERANRQAAAAREEEERRGQEKLQEEARQRAEEERRREEAQTKRRLDEAQAEKRRQDQERRKLEKEAAWAAKKETLHRWRGAAAGATVVALLMVGGIWLYRTTTPAGLTSTVVQPDPPRADKAKAAADAEA
jgi:hypothetical protein